MTLTEVYLVEETPMDPHWPPHTVAVYANELNALQKAEEESYWNVRMAEIEDFEGEE